jgi:hypothetical protein
LYDVEGGEEGGAEGGLIDVFVFNSFVSKMVPKTVPKTVSKTVSKNEAIHSVGLGLSPIICLRNFHCGVARIILINWPYIGHVIYE